MTAPTLPAPRADAGTLIRIGILTAPLAGALKLLGNLGTFHSIGYGIGQASEAATAAGPGFLIGELVGSTLPTVLTPFWAFALFAYLWPVIRARRTLIVADQLGARSWVHPRRAGHGHLRQRGPRARLPRRRHRRDDHCRQLFHLAGGLLTLAAGLWITHIIWRPPPHRTVSPTPAPSATPAHK